jgi:hypothetical protein
MLSLVSHWSMVLGNRLDDYLVNQCKCGRIAKFELRLPNYVRMYCCDVCEISFRRVHREAEFRKLSS